MQVDVCLCEWSDKKNKNYQESQQTRSTNQNISLIGSKRLTAELIQAQQFSHKPVHFQDAVTFFQAKKIFTTSDLWQAST